MANESDLRRAIVRIAEADTAAGGLVELTGKPNPAVRWGDTGMSETPRTAVHVEIVGRSSGSRRGRRAILQLDQMAGEGAQGLESRMADRWEEILTTEALAGQGIDGRVRWKGRHDTTELEEPGSGARLSLRGEITFTA